MLFIFQQPLFSHRWFLSVHLWQCLVVALQTQGIQVDEFHLRLFGVQRVNGEVYGL